MLEPGQVISGRYRILRVLGRGGMGAVYEAEAIQLSKTWAVKELTPPFNDVDERRRFASQFQQEARLLASLDHAGLPRIVDFFEEAGGHFLVMDYISGQDLQATAGKVGGRVESATVLNWLGDILDILAYLHGRNPPIIIRDIKPSNIMLTEAGTIKLIDFGIAKSMESDGRTATAIRGSGSPGFAPVEQYGAGGRNTDQRTDIYALGATIYYLLTGMVPPDSVERMISEVDLPPIQQYNPSVPDDLARVVEKMMGLMPAARYQNIGEVRQALGWGSAARPQALKVVPQAAPPLPVAVPNPTTPFRAEKVVEPPPAAAGIDPSPTVAVVEPSPVRVAATAAVPAAAPDSIAVRSMVNAVDNSELLLIPGGEFFLGSEEGEGRYDESPGHTVNLGDFYLARYPVTFEQYARFVETTRHETSSAWKKLYKPASANYPVTHVSLYDALAYCHWSGLRLPTEVEWEKAARGTDGRRFPWGDRWDPDRCNNWLTTRGNAVASMLAVVNGRGPTPPGCFPDGSSPFGILDQVGNVMEWTTTLYSAYPYQEGDGRDLPPPRREHLTDRHMYVLRGGGWKYEDSSYFRCASRFWCYPLAFSSVCGFRVAKSARQATPAASGNGGAGDVQ